MKNQRICVRCGGCCRMFHIDSVETKKKKKWFDFVEEYLGGRQINAKIKLERIGPDKRRIRIIAIETCSNHATDEKTRLAVCNIYSHRPKYCKEYHCT